MNRYRITIYLVWRTKLPGQQIKVRAATSHSARTAAARHWGLRSDNGLTSMVQPGSDCQEVQANKMPAAFVIAGQEKT